MWDTVGCLKNYYSTPAVNNISLSSACTVILSVFSYALEGRDLRLHLVCHTYAFWQVLRIILYIPLFSCYGVQFGVVGFISWCSVVAVLNSMPMLVFLNRMVIFLIFELW